jgi:hypothetical protein
MVAATRRFGVATAVLAAVIVVAAGSAFAAITVPAGSTVTISGTGFSACNALTYGYKIDSGPLVPVASKAAGCAGFTPAAGATISFPTGHVLRLYLTDNSCGPTTYLSDGNHGSESGTNPYTVKINDAGGGCNVQNVPSPPTGGNFVATVTVTGPPACTQTLTGDVTGPVTVTSGQSVCVNNSRVIGPVTVQAGGALTVNNSALTQGITSSGATFFKLCGSTVSGGLNVSNSAGPVIIGDASTGCGTNRVSGNVTLTGNTRGLILDGNSVAGDVTVNNNSGIEIIVKNNTLKNNANNATLACSGNNPAPTVQGNSASNFSGQCGLL